MSRRMSGSRRGHLVAFLLTAALIAMAQTPAAAFCVPPMELVGAAPEAAVTHRYAWNLRVWRTRGQRGRRSTPLPIVNIRS